MDRVNFLMNETDNLIDLVTGYMFSLQACKKVQLKTINRIDFQTLEWGNSIFYPNKYKNFYGCELIVTWRINYYDGFIIQNLFRMIFEEQLNAKQNCTTTDVDQWDCKEWDLRAEEKPFLSYCVKELIYSNPVSFYNYRFVIGPGEPYTNLERMFMMFDFELWIAIFVTLAIAFVATVTLNFVSSKIRNSFVGRFVQNLTMNMLLTFLTWSQSRVPGRKFARLPLILFIIW